MPDIPIVLEEPHFLVVNKPSGMFSQAAAHIPSLQRELSLQLSKRDQHPGTPFVGLPHRLDRGTSGVMLIARNQRSLKRFGQQFQSRKVAKYYLAIVEGHVQDGIQQWEDWLRKVDGEPRAEIVEPNSHGARKAYLRAECVGQTNRLSLLLVHLQTGRMHQIRIQAASRGFPVLGDFHYGASLPFLPSIPSDPAADITIQPTALHALRLEFRHPQTAKLVTATADWLELSSSAVRDDAELMQKIDQTIRSSQQLQNKPFNLGDVL